VYARTIENPTTGAEQTLTFGVSGKLIMNVLVMFDHETDTYWSQILGEAVQGSLTGTTLTPLAVVQTTWGEWKKLHPETRALATGGMGRYDSYSSYYRSNQAGVLGEARQDERVARKELVAGAVIDGQAVAYPHGVLAGERVVNDTVNGAPLAVFFAPDTATAQIYERTVSRDGAAQVLTFAPTADPLEFTDRETGSTWFLLSGQAISGPLAGTALTQVPSTSSFWFGWKDWHPDTWVYGVE